MKSYPSETAKIRGRVWHYLAPPVLDIGCGCDPISDDAIAVDGRALPEVVEVMDLDAPLPFADARFGTVYSSHTLEHLRDPLAALRDWVRVLRHGGHLILYLPHADLYTRPNPEHLHELRPEGMVPWMHDVGCEVVEIAIDDWPPEGYSFLIVGRKKC